MLTFYFVTREELLMMSYVDEYVIYLNNVKHASANTIASYKRDLKKLVCYFKEAGVEGWKDVTSTDLNNYIL